jgi:hypothetical protein
MDGILYEPRSLWSIANVTVEGGRAAPTRVVLNRQHFTNRTRWPMTLRRVAISAINYTLETQVDTPTLLANSQWWLQRSNIVQDVSLSISAPQRYHWNAKSVINAATCTPRPTAEPPQPDYQFGGTLLPWMSSYVNTSRLTFDYPMQIPRTSALEWQLSSFTPVVFGRTSEDMAPSSDAAFVRMLYQETGGMFFGSARVHEYVGRAFRSPGSTPLNPFADTLEKWPFPPDLASSTAVYTVLPGTAEWWDPRGMFSAGAFKKQNVTRDGSTRITDMRAQIDQFTYDGQVAAAYKNAFGGVDLTQRVTPLACRMSSRVRTVDCGSGAWWWRPGAPLCLTFDAQTPALVYDLPQQITLEPGDTLDVEMTFPPNTLTFGEGQSPVTVPFHVGVSFNGYSPIEG